jgi:hypothetical protein
MYLQENDNLYSYSICAQKYIICQIVIFNTLVCLREGLICIVYLHIRSQTKSVNAYSNTSLV